ncbi:hypothetical protein [Corynebacterium sp. A21]|uniref:hypothetical protein n=1 Tax=Corynebacterium sp. A21 TaxID=3457318 RepID=UPI003FD136D9
MESARSARDLPWIPAMFLDPLPPFLMELRQIHGHSLGLICGVAESSAQPGWPLLKVSSG